MPGSSLSVCLSVCLFRLSLIVHHKMYPALTPARASSRPDALCSSFSSSSPFSISSHLHPDPHPVYISISRPSSLALPFVHNVRPSVRMSVRRPASSAHLSPYVHTSIYISPPIPIRLQCSTRPIPTLCFTYRCATCCYIPRPPARPPASRPPITTTT